MAELTQKQEAFAIAFFEGSSAVEAYRKAYDVAENAKDGWIYVEASQLLDHPKIALRIKELRDRAEKHAIYTHHRAMEELEEARALALKVQNPAAAVSAINAKAKLAGLEAPTRVKADVNGSVEFVIRDMSKED